MKRISLWLLVLIFNAVVINIHAAGVQGPRLPAYPKAPSLSAITATKSPEETQAEAERQTRLAQRQIREQQFQYESKNYAEEKLKSGIMVIPKTLQGVVPYSMRGLIIILDASEEWPTLGAMTSLVWQALYSKVPLLVSASVLKNIFDPSLIKSGWKESINSTVVSAFKTHDWVIRGVGASLILLLPASLKISATQTVKDAASKKIPFGPADLTECELDLGLKIDHLKALDDEKFVEFLMTYQVPKNSDYFITALWNLEREKTELARIEREQKELRAAVISASTEQEKKIAKQELAAYTRIVGGSDLFVTNADYAQHNALRQQPQWIIYLSGHGILKGIGGPVITGLHIPDFRKLLEFLETKITTMLFIYSSCFSMGVNMQRAYADAEKPGQNTTYSFPIALDAFYDVSNYGDSSIDYAQKMRLLFDNFVWKEGPIQPYDIADVLQLVFYLSLPFGGSHVENYPYVRPSGRDSFMPVFPTVEIGEVMAQSRTLPLNIVAAAKAKGSKANVIDVLLSANYVPFTLVFDKGESPYLLSAVAGESFHWIVKIESAVSFSLLGMILKIAQPKYTQRKIFWINSFVEQHNGKTYKNIIIDKKWKIRNMETEVYVTEPEGIVLVYIIKDGVVTKREPSASDTTYLDRYKPFFTPPIGMRQVELQRDLNKAVEEQKSDEVERLIGLGAMPTKSIREHARANHIIAKKIDDAVAMALQKAVTLLNVTLVVEALAAGADPNALYIPDLPKNIPLLHAIIKSSDQQKIRSEIALLLINAGAKINIRNSDQETPLISATSVKNGDIVRMLIEHHADIDAANADGHTALIYAATLGWQDGVSLLLQAGADSTKRSNSGETALDEARNIEDKGIIDLLEKAIAAQSPIPTTQP